MDSGVTKFVKLDHKFIYGGGRANGKKSFASKKPFRTVVCCTVHTIHTTYVRVSACISIFTFARNLPIHHHIYFINHRIVCNIQIYSYYTSKWLQIEFRWICRWYELLFRIEQSELTHTHVHSSNPQSKFAANVEDLILCWVFGLKLNNSHVATVYRDKCRCS